MHWQYGGATNIFSDFCSLFIFGFGRRITSSNRINNGLRYLYSAAATDWRNTECRHIANALTLAAINNSMIYPKDIAKEIRKIWPKTKEHTHDKIPALPSDEVILNILETVYHTSFLTEESRRISVRVLFAKFEDLTKNQRPFEHNPSRSVMKFDLPRPFIKSELLRLAPATDPEKMLVCVRLNAKKELEIWGIYDIGSSWWKFIHGESGHGSPPPNTFTVSSMNPGNLSISRGGRIILNLVDGKINKPLLGIFNNGPISDFFERSQNLFYKEICGELKVEKWDKDGHDDDYPKRKYIDFIERIIFNIRQLQHGGTLIFIPDKISNKDIRLKDRVNIKYTCNFFRGWDLLKEEMVLFNKYFDLHFKLWDSEKVINVNDFHQVHILDSKRDNIEEAIDDVIRFTSSLSGVDGAVVMTDKLRLLGFGGEVIINSSNLTHVNVAQDSTGKILTEIPIESYGTRHRSAFRFCSSFEEAIAIIVSQDGSVKAVKRHEDKLILWPDINEGYFGI